MVRNQTKCMYKNVAQKKTLHKEGLLVINNTIYQILYTCSYSIDSLS